MENGIDQLLGLVVLIGAEWDLKLFFWKVSQGLFFLYGFVEMLLFELERFSWVGYWILGQLFIKFGDLMGLLSRERLKLIDLLLLLIDNWFEITDLLFIKFSWFFKGTTRSFNQLLIFILWLLMELLLV